MFLGIFQVYSRSKGSKNAEKNKKKRKLNAEDDSSDDDQDKKEDIDDEDDENDGTWMYAMMPKPSLWAVALNHRTEILYNADISLVTNMLELKPGSIVLESGTGSGSLSTHLANAVAPHGHLFTFEFHQQRSELARADFEKNGLSQVRLAARYNFFPSRLRALSDVSTSHQQI